MAWIIIYLAAFASVIAANLQGSAAEIYYCDNYCVTPGQFCVLGDPTIFTHCDLGGVRFIKSCGPGTHYDPTTSNCGWPPVPACPCSNPIPASGTTTTTATTTTTKTTTKATTTTAKMPTTTAPEATTTMPTTVTTSKPTTTTRGAVFVDEKCLECICLVETGCNPDAGCYNNGNCGPYQISYHMYHDCGVDGGGFEACANNMTCAEECIRIYMAEYAQTCVGPEKTPTCQDFARMHDTGRNGCNDPASIPFSDDVNVCYTSGKETTLMPTTKTTTKKPADQGIYYCDNNCRAPGHFCVIGDPNAFTQCDAFGSRFLKKCGPGTHFNPLYQVCDWPPVPACSCSNPIPALPAIEVIVDEVCLACICHVETGCNSNAGCSGGYCGPYRISYGYYLDCGVDGGGYEACTTNMACAEECIQNYMKRYAENCVGPYRAPTCQDYARIHDMGINGCSDPASIPYWNEVNVCYSSEVTKPAELYCDNNCMEPGHFCVVNNPNAFTQCDAFGNRFIKACGTGTMFHPELKVCVWASATVPTCNCNDPKTASATTALMPSGGMVDSHCLSCICLVETGCDASAGCYGGYCGPYRISYPYYLDCGVDGGGYEACTKNMACAEACIQNYMKRYAQACVGPHRTPTCQDFARIHDVGINGCNDPTSISYWNEVNMCYSGETTGRPPGIVDELCLNCICQVETGCDPNAGCSGGYCGPYRISYTYYLDCEVDGGGYEACTKNMACAEQCIHNYMKRYAQTCVGPNRSPTCQDFARIHDVGINGCNDPASIPYWNEVNMCYTGQTTGKPPGMVGDDCLQCICKVETGCDPNAGCSGGFCGPYQISYAYYLDCGVNGGGYETCTRNMTCAEQCIQNYMKRYAQACIGPSRTPMCQDFARIHDVGINGCNDPNSIPYWNEVNQCLTGKVNSGLVEEECLHCICQVETGCDPNAGCSGGYCGPYRISYPYYVDCGVEGGGYEACTKDKACAERCIEGYMQRYAKACVGSGREPTCQDFARIHDVGINGCNDPASLPYWYEIDKCLTNNNYIPPGLVDERCFNCLCDAASNCTESIGCLPGGYCGPYQLTPDYYNECGVDGGGFFSCANDKTCSELCIQRYMDIHGRKCAIDPLVPTCAELMLVHMGGPNACQSPVAMNFSETVGLCYSKASSCLSGNALQQTYFVSTAFTICLLYFLERS